MNLGEIIESGSGVANGSSGRPTAVAPVIAFDVGLLAPLLVAEQLLERDSIGTLVDPRISHDASAIPSSPCKDRQPSHSCFYVD
ncbi:hypothetical protein HZF05_14165 [Sphingomonas sp. CGMCC 1.13654]|uniref:Uncharacterized protein n=1 Tax=Sphingomonas chungangi TaxID=2683589 RepID=A0A838L9J8_9SPHN|nr:hypothetical protein [Sphingomonas chungangi]MBA2935229.1 hypothetical protein [Sphingomonas chungangi]MVW55307.1 hypothetical protein [Sphingomonas chungangi]